MKVPKPITIDFESFGIEDRPHYPPIPVGVSIKWPGKKSKYYAWGHVVGNNCSWGEAYLALKEAYANKDGILCQNGKFDVDVAEVHMGLPIPNWQDIHDTMFLLFLDDPHQSDMGLKPAGQRLLGHEPEERDEVLEWLVENQPIPNLRISRSKTHENYAMKYLPYAPGDIVGKYANSDTDTTEGIFKLLYKKTVDRGMLVPYDRERRLMPILLEMERDGIHVDVKRLKQDVEMYRGWAIEVDKWICKAIKAPAGINLDSGDELIQAMIASNKADESLMPLTPGGKIQTNKEALLMGVTDKILLGMLKTRASLKTCVNTFMGSWLTMAQATGGTIHTHWNQIRGVGGGTRTGRLSATWFMNIPKEFTAMWQHEESDKAKAKKLPKCPLAGMPSLPRVRSYIIPPPGEVFVDRDYSQQEPRILAHFDGGALMEKYIANPWIDFHDFAKEELEKMGKFYERKPVKNTNLGLIYGMGAAKLAVKNDMTVIESAELKKAILTLYPGLKDMYGDMRRRALVNEPIRTWGGREYFCEAPRLMGGRMVTFDYKLVNVLIQGSAADCTKESIIAFDDARRAKKKMHWKLRLSVHDQNTASVPIKEAKDGMETLRICMETVPFDVPMLSEGAISNTNWEDLQDYDKKGKAQPWQLVK